jgi:hypothetical protein
MAFMSLMIVILLSGRRLWSCNLAMIMRLTDMIEIILTMRMVTISRSTEKRRWRQRRLSTTMARGRRWALLPGIKGDMSTVIVISNKITLRGVGIGADAVSTGIRRSSIWTSMSSADENHHNETLEENHHNEKYHDAIPDENHHNENLEENPA